MADPHRKALRRQLFVVVLALMLAIGVAAPAANADVFVQVPKKVKLTATGSAEYTLTYACEGQITEWFVGLQEGIGPNGETAFGEWNGAPPATLLTCNGKKHKYRGVMGPILGPFEPGTGGSLAFIVSNGKYAEDRNLSVIIH